MKDFSEKKEVYERKEAEHHRGFRWSQVMFAVTGESERYIRLLLENGRSNNDYTDIISIGENYVIRHGEPSKWYYISTKSVRYMSLSDGLTKEEMIVCCTYPDNYDKSDKEEYDKRVILSEKLKENYRKVYTGQKKGSTLYLLNRYQNSIESKFTKTSKDFFKEKSPIKHPKIRLSKQELSVEIDKHVANMHTEDGVESGVIMSKLQRNFPWPMNLSGVNGGALPVPKKGFIYRPQTYFIERRLVYYYPAHFLHSVMYDIYQYAGYGSMQIPTLEKLTYFRSICKDYEEKYGAEFKFIDLNIGLEDRAKRGIVPLPGLGHVKTITKYRNLSTIDKELAETERSPQMAMLYAREITRQRRQAQVEREAISNQKKAQAEVARQARLEKRVKREEVKRKKQGDKNGK